MNRMSDGRVGIISVQARNLLLRRGHCQFIKGVDNRLAATGHDRCIAVRWVKQALVGG